jgi:hypothetical protein
MISQEQYARIARALPILAHADPELVREFGKAAFFTHILAGLFDFCVFAPLFGYSLSGSRSRAGK